MSKKSEPTVKVAELKARLSAYLRAARQGHAVTVCDRDTPIARLVPYASTSDDLTSRAPRRQWGAMALPPRRGRRLDSLAALLVDRQSSR